MAYSANDIDSNEGQDYQCNSTGVPRQSPPGTACSDGSDNPGHAESQEYFDKSHQSARFYHQPKKAAPFGDIHFHAHGINDHHELAKQMVRIMPGVLKSAGPNFSAADSPNP